VRGLCGGCAGVVRGLWYHSPSIFTFSLRRSILTAAGRGGGFWGVVSGGGGFWGGGSVAGAMGSVYIIFILNPTYTANTYNPILNNIANIRGGQPKDQFILSRLIFTLMYLYTYSQCASFVPNPKNTPNASIRPMKNRMAISGYTGIIIIATTIRITTHIL
jgi:hypothetical protein